MQLGMLYNYMTFYFLIRPFCAVYADTIIISVLVSVLILLIVLVGALLIVASRRKQRML